MRRLIVLAAALMIMWVLQAMQGFADLASGQPLTLAAIGFVVLASFTVGELGAQLGAPKVTGYIVAGLALGPQAANILSDAVVGDLKVFNTLALGLIATSAGLELDVGAIRRVWRSLTAMVTLTIPLLIVLVGGAFFALESFVPSLGLAPEAVLPMALIVAVLGIGTSPAIALAVVNDGRAKGRLTDLLLAIAVVKDLVVVVSLALALAVAKAMLQPGGALNIHVLTHVAEELGNSLVVGAILGALLIAYVRFIHKQMLLFMLLTVLVAAEVSHELHLELLLVFIVAGFTVRNLSPYEHELLHPLERISLPVYVVFFTTAGAGVDIQGTIALLPLALTLVVARVVAFYLAGSWGSAIGNEGPAVRDNAWLTWLPQAGVTLGLVLLAAKSLPDLAASITGIGMALVAINLVVGPVTVGIGLRRAGELGKAGAADAHDAAPEIGPDENEDTARPPSEEYVAADPEDALALVRDPAMGALLEALHRDLLLALRQFIEDRGHPMLRRLRDAASARVPPPGPERLDGLLRLAVAPEPLVDAAWHVEVETLYETLVTRIQELPIRAPLASQDPLPRHLEREEATGTGPRLLWRLRRLLRRRARANPPLRMLARERMEAPLATSMVELARDGARAHAALLEAVAASVRGESPATNVDAILDALEHQWEQTAEAKVIRALGEGVLALVDGVMEHASPLGRPRPPRYSRVEPAVDRARATVRREAPAWQRAVGATSEDLQVESLAYVFASRTRELTASWSEGALRLIEKDIVPQIDDVIAALGILGKELGGTPDATKTAPDWWQPRIKAAYALKQRLMLRAKCADFLHRIQPNALLNQLVPLLEEVPAELRVVGDPPVSTLPTPAGLQAHVVDVSRELRISLLDELVPEAARVLASLGPRMGATHRVVAEGIEVASYGLAVAVRGTERGIKADMAAPVARAIARLEADKQEILSGIEEARTHIAEELEGLDQQLHQLLVPTTGVARLQNRFDATRRAALTAVRAVQGGVTAVRLWLSDAGRALGQHPAIVERAIRTLHVRIDTDHMREATRDAELSREMASLFEARSVDHRRLFVGLVPAFDRLITHVHRPDHGTELMAVVIGRRGSGRTSLLNMVQLRARNVRVVRPDAAFHGRTGGLLAALATELNRPATSADLFAALTATRTLVIVDDLERFLLPSKGSLDCLQDALALASRSASEGTQWVVSLEASLAGRLDELTTITQTFHQRVELRPCDWQQLEEVMEIRARLGGLDVTYDPDPGIWARLAPGGPAEHYFKALLRASGGNLGAAIAAHRAALRMDAGAAILGPPRRRELPFVCQLGPESRAALGVLYQYGPMGDEDLAGCLGSTRAVISSHMRVLEAAGLVRIDRHGQRLYGVPKHLLYPLQRELIALRFLPEHLT